MSIRLALIGAVAGLALALAGVVGLRVYGHTQYAAGFAARDTQAQLEAAAALEAAVTEQARLQGERDAAEIRYQHIKDATDTERRALRTVSERLRRQTQRAVQERDAARAAGRVDGPGADWISGFAACYDEYGTLGADYARVADKLAGLQDYERAVASMP